MIVALDEITKIYNGKEILTGVCEKVEEPDRIGFVGPNGAGKSTLLKIICGQEIPDGGTVAVNHRYTIGYLAQNSGLDSHRTILEEMRLVFADLLDAQRSLQALERQIAALPPEQTADLQEEYARQLTYFEQREGYQIDVKIKTVLNGMSFQGKDLDTPIHTLSGGEKTRLAMAKLLLEQPDLLILDEPTNHLDFQTIMWLEDYLSSYKKALLIVSHDRYFLDKTVSRIWELERGRLTAYKGNYTRYTQLREEAVARQAKEYEIQQQQIAAMEDYVARNLVRASTTKMAQSRQKALERMELVEKPNTSVPTPKISFSYVREPVKDVLDVADLDITVGDPPVVLCRGLNLHVSRGEKIGVIGVNGAGKSTLLKLLQNRLPVLHGQVLWGRNTSVGYYDQEGQLLNPDNTVLEELWSRFPNRREQEIRNALGGVLLTGENVYKKVGVISGGERAKLALAVLMMEQPNVLLLDEPTNHLDLATKEVLERALNAYTGTILAVSHDRYFLNRIPDKILEITPQGAALTQGNFDDYLARIKTPPAEPPAPKTAPAKAAGYKSTEQKRQEAQARARLKELEQTIADLDASIALLEQEITLPEVYADYALLNEKCALLEEQKGRQEQLLEEWMELS